MATKSLFNIVLKVLGLSFLKDIIISVPALLSVFYSFGQFDTPGAVSTLFITLLTFLIYAVIIFYLVFKTEQVIKKFRLTENMPEDPIPLNVHRSTVVTISILVVALYIIAQAIPLFIRELTKWYQYNKTSRGLYNTRGDFDYSLVLVYAAEIIIGLLLIGNQRQLVNFIELRSRKHRH